MLELLGLNEVQERNVLMCCLGTMLSSRVVEVAFIQICYLLWELDKAYHEQYAETAAVRIYRRKQDTERKGHYPRIGHAAQAEWDIVLRLRKYADLHGLRVSERCTKPKQAGARCRHCPPLFFTTRRVKGSASVKAPVTRQMVTTAVKSSLSLIGVDTTHFSCLSMRRGGISAALTAKVQAPVLYLQSGHGSENAAFNYVVPVDPSVWYESFAAFGL